MNARLRIDCHCGETHATECGLLPSYGDAVTAFKADEPKGTWRPGHPLPAEPQTIRCACGITLRVVWFALDREGQRRPIRTRRGQSAILIGSRAVVSVYREDAPLGSWSWESDRFQQGKIGIDRSPSERAALEATLRETLFGAADGFDMRDKIAEGPAVDKRTGKALAQPSSEAHEARLIRDEIARIDSIGQRSVRVYAYPKE